MATRQRPTPEQIIAKPREAEAKPARGTAVARVGTGLAVTELPPDAPPSVGPRVVPGVKRG
jgi:hypothetical protein